MLQSFVAEVKSHEDKIESVRTKAAAVKSQGTPEDKKMVDRWVGDIIKRYDDLNFTLDEKEASQHRFRVAKRILHKTNRAAVHRWG